MFTGWVEYMRAKITGRDEFVSLEAKAQSQAHARSYEMFQLRDGKPEPPKIDTRSVVSPVLASPTEVFRSPYASPYGDPTDQYSTKEMQPVYRTDSRGHRRSPSPAFSHASSMGRSATHSPTGSYSMRSAAQSPTYSTRSPTQSPTGFNHMMRSPPQSPTGWNSPAVSRPLHSPTGSQSSRVYRTPSNSFSSPRAPSTNYANRMDWDPRSTHARGGLGFHPANTLPEGDSDYR
jgi:hypothetical protein